jgi:hypothetical protein
MQHVYVVGNNTGRFHLQHEIDSVAFFAPSLFSWRLYGPRPVQLPTGILSGAKLLIWVINLLLAGYEIVCVTAP